MEADIIHFGNYVPDAGNISHGTTETTANAFDLNFVVLIDEVNRTGSATGRSAADAPEIDGVVYVTRPYDPQRKLVVGEFVDVTIKTADAHDLWGEVG